MHRDSERPRIHRIRRRLFAEERDFERAPPRRGQRRQQIVDDVLEEVPEPHVGEAALRLGRSCRQNAEPQRAGMLDAGQPERRLPDAGFALEHESSRPVPRSVDESTDAGKFVLPADDGERHPTQVDGDSLPTGQATAM